jgi:hypothetical protein
MYGRGIGDAIDMPAPKAEYMLNASRTSHLYLTEAHKYINEKRVTNQS